MQANVQRMCSLFDWTLTRSAPPCQNGTPVVTLNCQHVFHEARPCWERGLGTRMSTAGGLHSTLADTTAHLPDL